MWGNHNKNKKKSRLPQSRRIISALLACTILTACSGSVLSPVHSPTAVDRPDFMQSNKNFAGNLPDAIGYANDWRQQMYDSVDEQSKIRAGVALSLIPLTATLVYLGINGTSTEVFSGLSILGTTVYSGSSLFVDEVRDRINLEGARAVTCSVASMAPLLVTKQEYSLFQDTLYGSKVGTSVSHGLSQKILVLRELISGLSANDTNRVRAESAISFATQVRAKGFSLDGDISRAASDLVLAVDNVVNQVNKQIAARLPDTNDIMRAAQAISSPGLSPLGTFRPSNKDEGAPGIAGLVQGDPVSDPVKSLDTRVADATKELRDSAAVVNRFVEMVGARRAKAQSLDTCAVRDVSTSFAIQPPETDVSLDPGEVYEIGVDFEGQLPRADFVGKRVDGVTLEEKVDRGTYKLVVTAKPEAAGKTATLAISETGGPGNVLITVSVSGKATTGPIDPKPDDKNLACTNAAKFASVPKVAEAQNSAERDLIADATKFMAIQRNLKTEPVDGRMGSKTRMQLCEWLKQNDPNANDPKGIFSSELIEKVAIKPLTGTSNPVAEPSTTMAPNKPHSLFEEAIAAKPDLLKAIQKAAMAEETGVFDAQTRLKLKEKADSGPFAADIEDSWPGGMLTRDLTKALMGDTISDDLKAILDDTALSIAPKA